jgi:hypothetical protein
MFKDAYREEVERWEEKVLVSCFILANILCLPS